MQEKSVIKKIFQFWFRRRKGNGLEEKIGYVFKQPELLAHALIHRSFLTGTDVPYSENNERLEFLGDSVLNMLTTEFLYKQNPECSEGELSMQKAAIVSGHACAQTAALWELGTFIRIGKNEIKTGGRKKESIIADAFEAVLGAVYLDAGLEQVKSILEKFHFPRIQEILSGSDFTNYKSKLLEFRQANGLSVPEYKIISESGPEHLKTFEIEVLLDGIAKGFGKGSSKKKAEQAAAHEALQNLNSENLVKESL